MTETSSKAIDAAGKPLILYHGSPSKFTEFDTHASMDGGIYFTGNLDLARSFSKDKDGETDDGMVFKAHLNLQTPKIIDIGGRQQPSQEEMRATFDAARAEGYDSTILLNVREFNGLGTQYVAFNANQIERAEEQAVTTLAESSLFKKWFSESKAVDAAGEPLVLYHGTGEGGFSEFTRQAWKTSYGHFFTPDKAAADFYNHGSQPQTYEVYLRIKNPLHLDLIVSEEVGMPGWLQTWIGENFESEYGAPHEQFMSWLGSADLYSRDMGSCQDDLISTAEFNGHDGVIFYDAKGGGGVALSYVVFESNQIMHAGYIPNPCSNETDNEASSEQERP